MVTALGIDVRRAFTLVFAIGGAAAALAGALGGVYFGSVSPGQGTLAADLRLHRGGHRRDGLGDRLGRAPRSRSAWCNSSSTTTSPGWATSAWSRCWPSCCWSGRRGWPACRREGRQRDPVEAARCPLGVLVLFAADPAVLHADIPGVFDGPLNSPGTLQLLAICLVFGGLATGYDLLFGRTGMLSFGHALYFAAGVYGTAILVNRTDWPLWLGGAGRHRRRRPAGGAARRGGPAHQRHRLRHGDAGLRPGRRDPGGPRPRRADRRRGGPAAGRRAAAGRAGRGGQHGQPVLARAGLRRGRRVRGAPDLRVAGRAGAGRGPRRRAPGRRARAEPVPVQAAGVRPRRRRWPRRAAWSTCCSSAAPRRTSPPPT